MTTLNTPWTLILDTDGTEDVATITDADGEEIVTSRPFWDVEGEDATHPVKAAVRLMHAAPRLLEALGYLLEQTVDQDLKYGITLSEGEEDARRKALTVMAGIFGSKSAA